LNTILNQTLQPREVIVVDDGSTDATPDVLASFAGRIHSIRITNSGDVAAKNVGVRAARYRLVAFCDSDDLWRPTYLAQMAALWTAEPAMTAAYGNFVIFRDGVWEPDRKFDAAPAHFWDGLREIDADMAVFDQPIVRRLLRFQPCFVSAMTVDRERFLSLGGWDESVSRMIGCDFATALRVAEHAPLGFIRQPLVGIRKHAGNFSGDVQAMNLGDARVLETVLANRPSLGPLADAFHASIAERRRDALDTAFARGDFAAVKSIYPLLPRSFRSAKLRTKMLVASLPSGLRKPVSDLLLKT
jgi:glycosyltransferase involved in cell wall biosynthesis